MLFDYEKMFLTSTPVLKKLGEFSTGVLRPKKVYKCIV